MSDAIKAEIKKLEDRRFRAMIDRDFDTLEGLLDDGLVYRGNPHTRATAKRHPFYCAIRHPC